MGDTIMTGGWKERKRARVTARTFLRVAFGSFFTSQVQFVLTPHEWPTDMATVKRTKKTRMGSWYW